MNIEETYNAEYIDSQYCRWKENTTSVSESWQLFFSGFEMASSSSTKGIAESAVDIVKQAHVEALVHRYRDIGHLMSCLDPLDACPTSHPLLDLSLFEMSTDDLEKTFHIHIGDMQSAKLSEILNFLKETYCRYVGVEYMHLQDPDEREWLQSRMEANRNCADLTNEQKIRILKKICHATQFEILLNQKYPGQTRFSLEGAEALISTLDALVMRSSSAGCNEYVFGMAHRGRLNVLVNILKKPYLEVFHDFVNSYELDSIVGEGDIKYHSGYLSELKLSNDKKVRMFLANNPSHLESVFPVVEGTARGLQDALPAERGKTVLPILIHGDAAFAGQGVVAETLNLSQLEGYSTCGSIHIVVNNQIGYTTLPDNARSTRYSTDIVKMLMVPIFHVHGEDPEALVHVVNLANDYRDKFHKDVVIDLVCYRKHGHNEGDEPYFTQPLMYSRIKQRPPLYKIYADKLVEEGVISEKEVKLINSDITKRLEKEFQEDVKKTRILPKPPFYDQCEKYSSSDYSWDVNTAVAKEEILDLNEKLNIQPENFKTHPKIAKIFKKRFQTIEKGVGIDWANAESLAFGSILKEGFPIRLSGQDSARGTFSQRHAVLFDVETGTSAAPLKALESKQGHFQVHNSSLSEMAVLGFEYGYSTVRPEGFTLWEAQFGDFVNNAQSIIDLYVVSGETKWQRYSGLVMLLPHGLEGLGPEHSSARPERFLQLCSRDNIQVCQPSTPAQYFHVLRRQIKSPFRKPLIILTPKSLLRNPMAVSRINDFSDNSFYPVLENPPESDKCRRVLLISGKVFYGLEQRRMQRKTNDIAFIRIEQYYPFPEKELRKVFDKYSEVEEWIWVQEEARNMGAYSFMKPRLEKLGGKHIGYIGRKSSSTPATGFYNVYRKDEELILDKAIGPAT